MNLKERVKDLVVGIGAMVVLLGVLFALGWLTTLVFPPSEVELMWGDIVFFLRGMLVLALLMWATLTGSLVRA